MFRTVSTLIVLLEILKLSSATNFNPKIIGGKPVQIEDYPYQVSIVYIDFHLCGGSVISQKHVLTAAHCTIGIDEYDLSVRAGTSILNEGGILVKVAQKYEHSDYNTEGNFDNDIAILELVDNLPYSSTISKISLPSNYSEIGNGTYGDITGWGLLSSDGFLPTQLQQVSVPILHVEDCRAVYDETMITDRMLCAGYPDGGKDACKGDSGGALNVAGEVVGIISWGSDCGAPSDPGVYTKVSHFRDFIDSVVQDTN